jgi:ketosteroid isomerase-like protein
VSFSPVVDSGAVREPAIGDLSAVRRHYTPRGLLADLVDLRGRGDVAAALACYEVDASIVVEPRRVSVGADAVRSVLEFFAASRATFTVIHNAPLESHGVALHLSSWSLQGVDPSGGELRLAGRSSDVVRRQPDGTWLIAIDNPWGSDDPLPEVERNNP